MYAVKRSCSEDASSSEGGSIETVIVVPYSAAGPLFLNDQCADYHEQPSKAAAAAAQEGDRLLFSAKTAKADLQKLFKGAEKLASSVLAPSSGFSKPCWVRALCAAPPIAALAAATRC